MSTRLLVLHCSVVQYFELVRLLMALPIIADGTADYCSGAAFFGCRQMFDRHSPYTPREHVDSIRAVQLVRAMSEVGLNPLQPSSESS